MEGHGFTISQERRKNVLARPGKLASPPGTQHNTEEGAKVGQRQMPEWKL